MNHFIIITVAVAILGGPTTVDCNHDKMDLQVVLNCAVQNGVDLGSLSEMDLKDAESFGKEHLCFFKCMMEGMGAIRDQRIDTERMRELKGEQFAAPSEDCVKEAENTEIHTCEDLLKLKSCFAQN